MVKSPSKVQQSARSNNNNNNPKSTELQLTLQPTKNRTESITTPSKKGNIVPLVSPTPNKHAITFPNAKLLFGHISNGEDHHILHAPLSVALTEFFLTLHNSHRQSIQAYTFINRSANSREDHMEVELRLQRGLNLMDLEDEPNMSKWHRLFQDSFISTNTQVQGTYIGDVLRELGLNLAASDLLNYLTPLSSMAKEICFPVALPMHDSAPHN
jgi:hypothetical protein